MCPITSIWKIGSGPTSSNNLVSLSWVTKSDLLNLIHECGLISGKKSVPLVQSYSYLWIWIFIKYCEVSMSWSWLTVKGLILGEMFIFHVCWWCLFSMYVGFHYQTWIEEISCHSTVLIEHDWGNLQSFHNSNQTWNMRNPWW